jgi:hypothetical protein
MAEEQSHDPAAARDYRLVLNAAAQPGDGSNLLDRTHAAAAAANNLANLEMTADNAASLPTAN